MLNALKSVLKNPILQSAGKTAVLLAILFFVGNFWWSAALFTAAAFYFYWRSSASDISLFYSFFIFLVIILISRWLINQWFFKMALIFASLSFFVILGLKNILFLKRALFYRVLNNFLFLLAFLIFFFLANPDFFWLKYLFVVVAVYCLFKEFFLLFPEFSEEKSLIMPISAQKMTLLSLCLAFLTSQFLWANSLLPIGFLNSSAGMMVIILVFKDLAANYLSGSLSNRLILKNITIFIVFTLAIFAASRWSL